MDTNRKQHLRESRYRLPLCLSGGISLGAYIIGGVIQLYKRSHTEHEPPYRVALCLSGGISLGAYIAGALVQLYKRLYLLNKVPNGPRFEIDVICGSSAGSVTGYILARALSVDLDPDLFEKAMKQCWITGLDIDDMLKPSDDESIGLISNECMDNIITCVDEIFGKKQEATDTRNNIDHDSTNKVIALWMTMTNLDGIPYEIEFKTKTTHSDTKFYAMNYRDCAPYFIKEGKPYLIQGAFDNPAEVKICWDKPVEWNDVAKHARISGAFPIAFPSVKNRRDLSDNKKYQDCINDCKFCINKPKCKTSFPDQQSEFQYADGGMFHNQPLARIIHE